MDDDEDDGGIFENEDDFTVALYSLLKRFGDYTSASGTAAQQHLRECITLLDRIAWSLEAVSRVDLE